MTARSASTTSGATSFASALISRGTGIHALDHHAGTTTLTGDSSGFSGTTTVFGGELIVGRDGSGALGGALTVASGGLLGGTGNVGSDGSSVTIEAGAVHAPGNSIGVQHVLGDYANHGTLRIEASPSEADRIVVAGAVDITGATLDLVLSPATAASWDVFNGPLTILEKQSDGAVVGTFGPVTRNLLFLDAVLDYEGGDGNDVTLELWRNDLGFAELGQTRNQTAAATAIGTLDTSHAVWRAIALAVDPDIVRQAFDALSGEIHASAKSVLIEDSGFVRNAIDGRLRAAFAAPGAALAPVLAYGPGDTPLLVAPDHAGPVFWSHGFGAWGSIDGDGNAAGLSSTTGGLLLGADGLVGDWRLGLLAGYSQSRFDVESRFSSGSSDNYHLGLYGGTQWGNLAFRSGPCLHLARPLHPPLRRHSRPRREPRRRLPGRHAAGLRRARLWHRGRHVPLRALRQPRPCGPPCRWLFRAWRRRGALRQTGHDQRHLHHAGPARRAQFRPRHG